MESNTSTAGAGRASNGGYGYRELSADEIDAALDEIRDRLHRMAVICRLALENEEGCESLRVVARDYLPQVGKELDHVAYEIARHRGELSIPHGWPDSGGVRALGVTR